jgi:hypothetical protein
MKDIIDFLVYETPLIYVADYDLEATFILASVVIVSIYSMIRAAFSSQG